MPDEWTILGLAATGLHGLGVLSAFHAILHARSPQGAVAWILSLCLLPYVTLPTYWIFGRRRFEGYVTARRQGTNEIAHVVGGLVQHAPQFRAEIQDAFGDYRAVERLAAMPFTHSNALELLIDGTATFDSILAGIESAQSYILFQFFIVKDDDLGRRVRETLETRARAGVRVHFLYDEIGSNSLSDAYLSSLREAGVLVSAFHSTRGRKNRFQINFRNHRKIVVVDGRQAWIGGHNVGDEYVGKSAFGRWRDTHVRMEGPAVQCTQLAFLEDWYWATHTVPELEWAPAEPKNGADHIALVLPTGPADEFDACGLFFAHSISVAQRRLWIASPYFVPDSSVLSSLQLAALRGVDVRILLPGSPDHKIVWFASFSFLPECERAGVKFYRYEGGFLHQKVMLIDDEIATVGTANLDNRSFRLNFEITAVIDDIDFASEVEEMLEADFAESRRAHATDFTDAPLWFRLTSRSARLLSPIL